MVEPGCNGAVDTAAVRRRRARLLIDQEFKGIDAGLAERIDTQPSQVSRWFMENPKHRRNIGEKMARRIEKECGLPPGWMDNELDDSTAPRARHAYSFDERMKDRLLDLFDKLKPSQRKTFLQSMAAAVEDNIETVRILGERLAEKPRAKAKA